jgi:predicted acyltransferase
LGGRKTIEGIDMSDEQKETNPIKERLMSLDVLRGFDMFWIIGGDYLFRQLTTISDNTWDNVLGEQLEHVAWAGFRFYDLIFPLFMFLAGVSIPYAISRKVEQGVSRAVLLRRIIRRVVLLIVLGMVYNGMLRFDFENLRVASVLAQIGIAYGIAAGIVLFSRKSVTPLYWCVFILAMYSIAQLFVPVPGHGAGVLTQEGCINGYIDRLFLPGRLYGTVFDPEGLMCILSASAIVLMGVQAGALLRTGRFSDYRKTMILAGCGVALFVAGILLSPFYPPIKAAWTSTFNLMAGGLSLMLLALFYLVIDVWKMRRWSYFFYIIGLNSITIYIGTGLIDFGHTADFLFSGIAGLCGPYQPVVLAVGVIAVEWFFLWVLYRKKIFLKV